MMTTTSNDADVTKVLSKLQSPGPKNIKTKEGQSKGTVTEQEEIEMFKKIESHLLQKVDEGDKVSAFLLGQFYYEEGLVKKARKRFEAIKDFDFQALYQLGMMYYDGIGGRKDMNRAFEYMMVVAETEDIYAAHLKPSAQFNVGRAYFEGYGVKQSDKEAEKWWLKAAADGDPRGSIEAQTMLGMFYSRPEFIDLKKSFFWHSEACGNGSLESQGILGVMYMFGEGIKKDFGNAFECLKAASDRGNVYAQGRLVQLYYERKLFNKACDLAKKVVAYTEIEAIASETGCLATYIVKGIALACFYMSRCLFFGKGLQRNIPESKKYLQKLVDLDPVLGHDLQMDMAYGLV